MQRRKVLVVWRGMAGETALSQGKGYDAARSACEEKA